KPKGCQKCGNTGFKGRTGLHEVLVMDMETKRLIQSKALVDLIRESAIRHGMRTLKQDGIWKVLKGDTTIEKVREVCSV
ncbi:MAG: general secretion pathway protein GspE, partial [Nitrospinae bacterium]|nr:general secretion pathway protein GspE [Nitrospinota bacterium]